MNGRWLFPAHGTKGSIKDADDETMALGVLRDWNATETGPWVIIEVDLDYFSADNLDQQWDIGLEDDLGYFTVKFGSRFLTANNDLDFTVEGMYFYSSSI